MLIRELIEATQIWSKKGSTSVRKYRCTSGVRKGRVMSSPAACSKPVNAHKSKAFKQTRSQQAPTMKFKSKIAKKSNPASNRNIRLNKSVKPKKSRRKIR